MGTKARYPAETANGKPRTWVKARETVRGMHSWFDDINDRGKNKSSRDGRTVNEQCFDSGVFTAAELVRRLTGDDELSLAIHEACIWRQREHQSAPATP